MTSSLDRVGLFLPTEDSTELVRLAEDLGYESVWAGEGQGRSAFGKLEAWAVATDRIGLATGIVNVFTRTPATIAQEIATLDSHSNGRAILGLGTAHPGVVEGFHGTSFERPLPRVAEYIRLIRRYLASEASAYEGTFYSPDRTSFWDAFEPLRDAIPIYNAALGQANVRLTGELADGWVPNFYPRERFTEARDWLAVGADRGGRRADDIDVAMYILVVADENQATAREQAARHIAFYVRDIPGYYARSLREVGYEDVVNRIEAASSTNAGSAEVTDDLIDSLAIAGTPTEVRAELASLVEAGVDLPIIRAPTGTDHATIESMLRAVAPP
ncbi:LLM class flavin-dependent oxidoreductase (plasmid) [Haloferax sp. S1W]|uniref:LLM class flavin-dependent oxidoreductase n=1 Tax=Haloferax sp. S1W TaxID=3377110 RepID=UPI0037C9C9A8